MGRPVRWPSVALFQWLKMEDITLVAGSYCMVCKPPIRESPSCICGVYHQGFEPADPKPDHRVLRRAAPLPGHEMVHPAVLGQPLGS